jgi:hypothetical protein
MITVSSPQETQLDNTIVYFDKYESSKDEILNVSKSNRPACLLVNNTDRTKLQLFQSAPDSVTESRVGEKMVLLFDFGKSSETDPQP